MLYKDIHTSLLKFCQGVKTEWAAAGQSVEVIYFDAHADENTLPNTDVLGISGLSVSVDESLIDLHVMFGISTVNDTNLFRLVDLIDQLFYKLQPDKIVKIYDATTGANKGVLKVKQGTRVMPVAGSDTRPVQYILVSMASDRTMPR